MTIQRWWRFVCWKQRLWHAIMLMQRVSRGGLVRRHLCLFSKQFCSLTATKRILIRRNSHLMPIDKMCGAVAGAFVARLSHILILRTRKELAAKVLLSAMIAQKVYRGHSARCKWADSVVEARRRRHEALLRNFLEREVSQKISNVIPSGSIQSTSTREKEFCSFRNSLLNIESTRLCDSGDEEIDESLFQRATVHRR